MSNYDMDKTNVVSSIEFQGFGKAYVPFQKLYEIYSPERSLEKGTAFPELDQGYEHGKRVEIKKPDTNIKSKIFEKRNEDRRSEFTSYRNNHFDLLQQLAALDFTVLDLGLYLNINPHDEKAARLHQQFSLEARKIRAVYENTFGPLTSKSEVATEHSYWEWAENPWPWEYDANFKLEV